MRELVKRKLQAEIFTGSMADISFLIIIYFMLTSVLALNKGLDFGLPDSSPEVVGEEAIDVAVDRLGEIRLDGHLLRIDELSSSLTSRLEAAPGKPVLLRTHSDAPFRAMVEVYDELRLLEQGLGHSIDIAIPTERELTNLGVRRRAP